MSEMSEPNELDEEIKRRMILSNNVFYSGNRKFSLKSESVKAYFPAVSIIIMYIGKSTLAPGVLRFDMKSLASKTGARRGVH